jgi:hypothetical protein
LPELLALVELNLNSPAKRRMSRIRSHCPITIKYKAESESLLFQYKVHVIFYMESK